MGAAALVRGLDSLGLQVSFEGVALLGGDGDVEEEDGGVVDALLLLEPAVLAALLIPLPVDADRLGVARGAVVGVEVEHRRVLLVAVVQREAEVGNALAVGVVRRPGARLRVVGEEDEDLVLLDQLLGA